MGVCRACRALCVKVGPSQGAAGRGESIRPIPFETKMGILTVLPCHDMFMRCAEHGSCAVSTVPLRVFLNAPDVRGRLSSLRRERQVCETNGVSGASVADRSPMWVIGQGASPQY